MQAYSKYYKHKMTTYLRPAITSSWPKFAEEKRNVVPHVVPSRILEEAAMTSA
jgi:hypothetical protein